MNKKLKKTIIKMTVSILLIGLIFSRTDLNEVLVNLRQMKFSYFPLILGLLIANYLISSFRWQKLLIFKNTKDITVLYLTRLYFIGAFFNNFMPTSIGGDVYKIYKLGKRIKSNTNAFTATFMERFTGIVALVLISYFGLVTTLEFFIALMPTYITNNGTLLMLIKILLFVGFWIGTVSAFLMLKIASKRVTKLKGIYDSLMLYKDRPKVLGWAMITSFIVQFLSIFTQYYIFIGLGADVPINFALFVLPVITISSFFIPSLNGVGVQDALYIQLFGSIGVSPELALSASIIYHLFRLFVSLIGGIMYAAEKDN